MVQGKGNPNVPHTHTGWGGRTTVIHTRIGNSRNTTHEEGGRARKNTQKKPPRNGEASKGVYKGGSETTGRHGKWQ